MTLGWRDWNRNDVLYGIVAPIVVILTIVGLSRVMPFLLSQGGGIESMGIVIGIISTIEEMVIIVGVPLLLGLAWNRWAGGASGFVLGSIYAMWFAVSNSGSAFSTSQRRLVSGFGPTILGWVLSAMLIGYMAGALNKRSENFRRMLIAGVAATSIGGVFLFGMFQLSSSNVVTGIDGFLLTVLTRAATGVIIPVIAKVFMWYGLAMNKK